MSRTTAARSLVRRITPQVAKKLGFYVYLYVNPLDDAIFYIGKGKNRRALTHLKADEKKRIARIIAGIRKAGQEPRIEILAHGPKSQADALKVEAAAIDLLGLSSLANRVRGHGVRFGRMPLDELSAHYTRRSADIRESAVLIRISRQYRYGMSEVELYDATRSAWKVGPRRKNIEYAFAVFDGVIREVYRITEWLPAGSTFLVKTGGHSRPRRGRFEFVGVLADASLRRRYVNKYVGHLFDQGAQNPISYVNVKA
jgi:hypothetical protein